MENTGKKYHQINYEERRIIERLLKNNTPKKQIARLLNRSITTIRKEIKRGSVEQREAIKTTKKDPNIPLFLTKQVYFADVGQRDYKANRANCGCKCKIFQCRDFVKYVENLVQTNKWSLDAAKGFAEENDLFSNMVTTQTLYNWVDLGLMNIRNIDLPRKVMLRHHKKNVHKGKRQLGRSIDERPIEINDRIEFGHWEGDGIVGKNHKGHWISMVERKTRMGFLFNVHDKSSERIVEVIDKLEYAFGDLFSTVFKSITFDNGTEFADYESMEKNSRTVIYYAHPYTSCERGTNENWNGIVRRFAPKGSDFDTFSDDDLRRITNVINDLPRKMFDYKTPKEMFIVELEKLIDESAA